MPMAGMILKSLRQATSHAINLANAVCVPLTWVPIIYICQIQQFQDEDYNISLKSIYEKEEKWKKNIGYSVPMLVPEFQKCDINMT